MKRSIRIALALLGVLVATAGAALWEAGRAGSGAVEKWLSGQIQLVAGAYLKPKLTFTDLDYVFPATVRLKNLRLSAEDPISGNGRTLDVIACEEVMLELTEAPKVGRPVRIAAIVLTRPTFQAVAVGDGSPALVGFSDLMRDVASGDDVARAAARELPRLSEFIQMRRVELIDGRIVSDPRLPGVPRMELDRINTALQLERAENGWYTLHTRMQRDPLFDLSIDGRLNLDTFTAADAVVTVRAQIGREHDGYLPPEMQQFLRRHDVRGALEATVSGEMPLIDPARGRLDARVTLRDAHVAIGDYRVPVDSLQLLATLADERVTLSQLHVQALRGQADVIGMLALNPAYDADVRVSIRDMILDDTIREGTAAAQQPKYGGRANATLVATAPLKLLLAKVTAASAAEDPLAAEPLPKVWGEGKVQLDQARLTSVPLVGSLAKVVDRGKSVVTGGGGKTRPSERATVVFTLGGDGAKCSEITYVGTLFAARGRGMVMLDRRLDLIVNAGPIEKMQSLLGRHVGGALGKVTDAMAGYHVTGTIEQPKVEVQVAGGAVNRAGRAVGNGVGKVVGGLGGRSEKQADAK